MRQRPYPPAPPLWRAFLDRLLGRPRPSLPASLDRIPESALVALAALEHYDDTLVQRPIDSSVTLPGPVATALVAGERTSAGSQDALERHRPAYVKMAGRVQVR
jgi:hypothetical protein